MSPLRRLLSLIGLIVLAISLVMLALSLWPAERSNDRQTLPPDDLSLPTPQEPLATEPLPATSAPTGEPLSTLPAIAIPTPMPRPAESRAVELDYPLKFRVGDSDVIRLALIVAAEGTYPTPTAESSGHVSTGEPVKIPNLYDTHTLMAIARLDAVGLQIDRPGDWEQPVLSGENVTWRWAIAADETGRQRANLSIRLRFIPKADGEIVERELWARTLAIETTTVFGLSRPTAQAFGAIGGIGGFVLGFPFADNVILWLWKKITGRSRKKK